jgi:transposase-like protein
MAHAIFDQPQFNDEAAAFEYVEALLWPKGPLCPHCGNADPEKIGTVKGRSKPSRKHPEGVERHGLRKCYMPKCRTTFTVRNGSIFEDSHLALRLWLQAIHLMCASKKGISTRQIQRLLNCSMKTAWHLTHRIREIMKPTDRSMPPLGGSGVTLEADETYIGGMAGRKLRRPVTEKHIVLSLVERRGQARSFHVPNVRASTVGRVLSNNTRRQSTLMTDEASVYKETGWNFARHDTVVHSQNEYVRGDAHTNSVEGFFSILKRGLFGTYQAVSEAHLHRYLNEFDYRYNTRERLGVNDKTRAGLAVRNAKGRRLTYERLG